LDIVHSHSKNYTKYNISEADNESALSIRKMGSTPLVPLENGVGHIPLA